MKQAQLEENRTKKGNAMSRVAGQQNEQNQDNVKKLKTRECQKQQQQGGGEQEHGVETTWTDGPGPLWELHGIT